jgi:Zn ribbon nucleic-acid-binding protein
MAEYIDREKAIEFIRLNYCKDCNSYNGAKCRACSFDDAMLGIEDVPTADVVEVVRCKDCKFYKLRNVSSRYKPTKPCCLRTATIKVNETDFCSYGEKRSEGND